MFHFSLNSECKIIHKHSECLQRYKYVLWEYLYVYNDKNKTKQKRGEKTQKNTQQKRKDS